MVDKKRLNKVSFLWDLDGTLIDSYESIMWCLKNTLFYFKIWKNEKDIVSVIRQGSVQAYLEGLGKINCIDTEKLVDYYYRQIKCNKFRILAMPHAKEILSIIKNNKFSNFLITNRDSSTKKILMENDMECYFKDIITSENGFKRKPCPDSAVYLIDKYGLEPKFAYYIGDRPSDMLFAQNAGINGIMYHPIKTNLEEIDQKVYMIHDLLEIQDLIFTNIEKEG